MKRGQTVLCRLSHVPSQQMNGLCCLNDLQGSGSSGKDKSSPGPDGLLLTRVLGAPVSKNHTW